MVVRHPVTNITFFKWIEGLTAETIVAILQVTANAPEIKSSHFAFTIIIISIMHKYTN
jgi:hypothetical protein